MSREYITLVTSLPHLPQLERADRLPITERALLQRLGMLEDDDAAQLRRAGSLLRWQRHSAGVRTEQIEQQYRIAMQSITNPALRDYVDWEINGRTTMAALRLKARGQSTPPDHVWGVGRLMRSIQANWEKPDFGLRALFPWLEQTRQFLMKGDALSLDRLQMTVVWRRLTTMGELNPFGFEYVAAYAFRWEILRRRIAYDPEKATQTFQKLIQEVIGEHRFIA